MKKVLAIFILAVYTLGITGVGVDTYFCCGKVTSVNLESALSSSLKNTSHETGRCCKNVKHFFKVRDSHQQPSNEMAFGNSVISAPDHLMAYSLDWQPAGSALVTHEDYSPPDHPDAIPLYIQFSVFRI